MEGFSSDSEGDELENAVFVAPEETLSSEDGVETEGGEETEGEGEEEDKITSDSDVQDDLEQVPKQVPKAPAKRREVPLRSRRKAIPTKRNPTPKKRRFRPGTVALREIRKYQKSTEDLLRVLPFKRLVREIAGNLKEDLRFTGLSFKALQSGTEAYAVELLERAGFLAGYRKSTTIAPIDVKTAAFLLKDKHRPC